MTTRKLDIFWLLSQLNDPNKKDIYASLNDHERSGFAPLVVMRWMSGTADERQIMLLNEFVNPAVFSLGRHPHLLMKLLQVCSSKIARRYYWQPIKSKKKMTTASAVVGQYWEMSSREVRLLNPFPPQHEVMSMAEQLGLDQETISKLKKEFND